MLTKLLPSHLHVTAIGIGSALGAGGSTIFPIAAGQIANRRGYYTFLLLVIDSSFLQIIRITMIHPLSIGIYAAELALLCLLPGLPLKTPGQQG